MDPLSITLAVITLATALKDIIETAEIIQDSFSKLPQNYRNANRLAEEVLETLHGMEQIYEEHEETFNKNESLKKAIKKLQEEMKSAHEQCACLLPPVSERKRDRFKIAWYSFWRRGKVEERLSELKSCVDRCSQQFHFMSSLRTEARVIELHDTIVQATSHCAAMVHSRNSLADTGTSYNELRGRTNSQLCAFTQSTPAAMTWMTDTIPICDLSNAYLRREVGRVNRSLQSVLAMWSQNLLADMEIPPWLDLVWDLNSLLRPVTIIHQDAVVVAFQLQSLLQGSKFDHWLDDVQTILYSLTAHLYDLDMHEDYLTIQTSIATIWRRIARWHPQQLPMHLRSEEAIEIISSLAVHESAGQSTKQDIRIIAEIRILHAKFDESSHRSLRLALDGHDMLEFAFKYALNLVRIARIHRHFKLSTSSRKLANLALTILKHLLARYPGSGRILRQLEMALSCLFDAGMIMIKSTQSDAQNLEGIEQYVNILRRLAPINPQIYVEPLARALWSQREALLSLGRSAEAETAYEDIIRLKDLVVTPAESGLRIPSETEADYYTQLASYHYISKRFTDAIYAAQHAISHALVKLFYSFYATHQYDKVLSEGCKVIKLIDNSSIPPEFGFTDFLNVLMDALEASSHPEALAQAADLYAHIRRFLRSRELKFRKELAPTLIRYADLLQKKGMVGEAAVFLREMLNDW
ncbi:hypothetical protein BJ912DRAFT_991026 [Pholiota molesta]|nr:hypothetical protein BJ912DRAFT_991026 [Pholiota molesta]